MILREIIIQKLDLEKNLHNQLVLKNIEDVRSDWGIAVDELEQAIRQWAVEQLPEKHTKLSLQNGYVDDSCEHNSAIDQAEKNLRG